MKKTAPLFLSFLSLLCSCNQPSGGSQTTHVGTFNVLEYDYLAIYKADGNILDLWKREDSGTVCYLLKYYSELKLDLYTDYYRITGAYTYSNATKNVDLVYSTAFEFKLYKSLY